MLDGKCKGFGLGIVENDFTETGASGIVHVYNGVFGTGESFECSSYEVFSRRSEYLSSTCFQQSIPTDVTKSLEMDNN